MYIYIVRSDELHTIHENEEWFAQSARHLIASECDYGRCRKAGKLEVRFVGPNVPAKSHDINSSITIPSSKTKLSIHRKNPV